MAVLSELAVMAGSSITNPPVTAAPALRTALMVRVSPARGIARQAVAHPLPKVFKGMMQTNTGKYVVVMPGKDGGQLMQQVRRPGKNGQFTITRTGIRLSSSRWMGVIHGLPWRVGKNNPTRTLQVRFQRWMGKLRCTVQFTHYYPSTPMLTAGRSWIMYVQARKLGRNTQLTLQR